MAGEPKYTHDQIALILLRWVQGVSAAETAVEYARVFNVEVLESQVKYVKNKYCKEPRFGTPLWTYKNRPEDYEKFLQEHPPAQWDPEEFQARIQQYLTPNGTFRISDALPNSTSQATPSQSQPQRPATRARTRRAGTRAATWARNARARAESSSSAALTAETPMTAASSMPSYDGGLAGGLSGYDGAPAGTVADTTMGGVAYPTGQQPLPELFQAPLPDVLPTVPYLQNTFQDPAGFTTGATMNTWGPTNEAIMNTWEPTNDFMADQNDFNLYDPRFGNGWNDSLSFNELAASPTFYKSTLDANFVMPGEDGADGLCFPMPMEGLEKQPLVEGLVEEQPLTIDPALFESFDQQAGIPEGEACSLMDMLTSEDAPDFLAGQEENTGEPGEGEDQGAWDPVLDEEY